jgi:hypothetical protein
LDVGLDLLLQEGATNWLTDMTQVEAVTELDRQWVADEWLPRAVRAGLRNMALVEPRAKASGALSIKAVMEESHARMPIRSGVTTARFANADAAVLWLRRQNFSATVG